MQSQREVYPQSASKYIFVQSYSTSTYICTVSALEVEDTQICFEGVLETSSGERFVQNDYIRDEWNSVADKSIPDVDCADHDARKVMYTSSRKLLMGEFGKMGKLA